MQSDQATVNYGYDALGRLLMRDQGSDDQVFYWLGLNRLAVEQWGAESGRDKAVFHTIGATPTDVTFNITPLAGSPYTNGDHIVVPVGTHYMDGEWHYVEQDLLGIFEDLRPTWDFVQFDAMIVYAEDAYIDDIVLSGGSMARSYQVVPGAALGGTLAVQTGTDGGEGVGAWETAYYHYNDLGTVLATTDSDGDVVGAWVPDYNGNYTNPYLGGYKYTGSPDRPEIGLTGKWFDDTAGLYYFNARWLDPERARWMSEEPTGIDGPNLYHFVFGNPINGFDPNGEDSVYVGGENGGDWWSDHRSIVVCMDGVCVEYDLMPAGGQSGQKCVEVCGGDTGIPWEDAGVIRRTRTSRRDMQRRSDLSYTRVVGRLHGNVIDLPDRDVKKIHDWLELRYQNQDYPYKFPFFQCQTFVHTARSQSPHRSDYSVTTWSGGCFVKGTLIRTQDHLIPIENIRVNDEVISFDFQGETNVSSNVIDLHSFLSDHIYVIKCDGFNISVTGYHPVWISESGWTEVRNLCVNDRLIGIDGENHNILAIELKLGSFQVYNITVENTHNYYAGEGSILFHNK